MADSEMEASSLRQRKLVKDQGNPSSGRAEATTGDSKEPVVVKNVPLSSNTFWLTRIIFIRSLGFIYCKSLYINFSTFTDF